MTRTAIFGAITPKVIRCEEPAAAGLSPECLRHFRSWHGPIGAAHRIASRLDDEYVLVAGALSSTPARTYADYDEMVRQEVQREDGVELVSIVTPNSEHMGAALAFIESGVHVICDKPLTTTLQNALKLKAAV